MKFDSLEALSYLKKAIPDMLDYEVSVSENDKGIETYTLGVFDQHLDLHRIRWQDSSSSGCYNMNEMLRMKLEELSRGVEDATS